MHCISKMAILFVVFCLAGSAYAYTKEDLIGTWHLVGVCETSQDIGTYVFHTDNTFKGKMTDEDADSWNESGTYSVQGNEVTMDFGNDYYWNLTFSNSKKMTGYCPIWKCDDVLYQVSSQAPQSSQASINSGNLDIYIPSASLKTNKDNFDLWLNLRFDEENSHDALRWKLDDTNDMGFN